eukprot:Phypoly_transcript_15498.p1 GENE.Phypoly_transcript_15498~~Phypoly_transcript_15498.p1  ORF type:complete len:297 (+),score=30.85 Phypoly_transcript_15498:53-892(+)
MAKCAKVSHQFLIAAKATFNRKYKGKTTSEINIMNAVEDTIRSFEEDLKEINSLVFTDGWGVPYVPNEENFLLAKIGLLGSRGCGATTLLQRGNVNHNIGLDFSIKRMFFEGQLVKLQYFDKPFRMGNSYDVPSSYFRNANVLIILYDTTKGTSVLSEISKWLNILLRHVPTNGGIALFIGTKSDIKAPATFTVDKIQRHVIAESMQFGYMGGSSDANGNPKFPYVIETRTDVDGSIETAMRLAALLAIRHKRSLPVRIEPQPPKKSIVSSLRNLFGKK